MTAKSEGLTKRQLRAVARVQALKTIPVIIIMLSLFFYQAEWFNSLQKIEITYDFSNYQIPNPNPNPNSNSSYLSGDVRPTQLPAPPISTQAFTQNNTFYQYVEQMVQYIEETSNITTANLTQAEQTVIEQQEHYTGPFEILTPPEFDALSNIGQIEYLLKTTITAAHQIYSAYLNGSLVEQYILQFLRDVWRTLIDEFLPEEWKNPSHIYIENNGTFPIRDLEMIGTFHLNQNEIIFLHYNTTELRRRERASISLSLIEIIKGILEITFEELVLKTLQILREQNFTALLSFPEYLKEILLAIKIEAQLMITARLGLIPISIAFRIDLTSIIQSRIVEALPE
jgi:hypothetical protein